ncbi:ATP-binding protein [Metabacillus fastidiosus]|uniref:HD domain-containing protein n=1 Tax=Metabacillus fastidiosus TaxID=1458 RepID=UPI002E21AEEB|nr:ATP-binding protein [Metabacillus fastidiosus]
MIYLKKVSEALIDMENKNFKTKPFVFEKQIGFPYHDLQPRDFERLIFCLFRQEISNDNIEDCDEIQLMQGVGERGRDSLLLKKGEPVGVIQCKRYKNNINISEVGKEIIKFILHYTQDNKLIPNLNSFTYMFVVSYGFSENALNFINSLSSNTYNKDEIERWAKEIISKTASLQTVIFDDIKHILFECLNKITFKKIIPDDLNIMIEKHPEVKKTFFELKSIIDVDSFEKILIEREKEKIEFIYNSSNLERLLEEKNKYLYNKLQDTKKIVQNLINEYSANFTLYTYHNKTHTVNLIEVLGKKLLDQSCLNELNEKELYVLTSASYLHDIGICISNDEIKEEYQKYLDSNNNYNKLEMDEYIRDQHSCLTFNFISRKWAFLGLESEWKDAIALVAGENRDINIFDYEYFEYSPDGGREKVCVPYLHALLKIGDMIDIENVNANYLLRNYEEMEEYIISKKIWEEVDLSIKTNIKNEDILEFSGDCNDQLLFISISRHIEELKRLYEQLILEVRKYRYDAKFSISFIREAFDTAFGKRIGFSIDYKGIAETLIGENIYEEKYDAVREVIQNSIDSCSLKKRQREDYQPFIEIELTETDLIIRDNGLGMNEYIIMNYFSKLCKSYYKDFGLDAIGQFGIGVFSYFMLCDSFTVETRIKEGNIIKFKAYKNLYSYFYFYQETVSQLEEGTIISLHLKENILKELEYNKLITIIKDFFKFVDIPIKIINKDSIKIVEKGYFGLGVEKQLANRVPYEYRHKINDLTFLESHIENEAYEGVCGLIFEKSVDSRLKPFYVDGILGRNFIIGKKDDLLICHKGVKVTDSFPYEMNGKFLKNLIGRINIKMGMTLNLGRNNFQDEELSVIINEFEMDLLSKFFNSIHNLGKEQAYLLNSQFVNYYIDTYSFPYRKLENFILNNFYVEVFNKNGKDQHLLSEFLYDNKQFVFGMRNITEGEIRALYQKNGLPVVYINNISFQSFYYRYFKNTNYSFSLNEESELLVSRTEVKKEKLPESARMIIPFSNNLLFEIIGLTRIGEKFYNFYHPLIQFYIENENKIKEDKILHGEFDQFFKYIESVDEYSGNAEVSLKQLNTFLEEILIPFKKKIKISSHDFPIKYREKVLN